MNEIIEQQRKGSLTTSINKGFNLSIKKSVKNQRNQQETDLLNHFDKDNYERNPDKLIHDDILQDIDNDFKQLQSDLQDNDKVGEQQEYQQISEKSPSNIWKYDVTNQLSPCGILTIENQNITSGDGFFKDETYSQKITKNQVFKLEKEDDYNCQNLTNEPSQFVTTPHQNNQSTNFSKITERSLRKYRASKLSMADRQRERQQDSKQQIRTNMQEIQQQILKKIKLKKALMRQGTQGEKSGSPGLSFISHIKQINILKRFQNKMKNTITKSDLDSLSKFQLQLVNDKSHIIQNLNSKLSMKAIKDKLKWIFSVITRKDSYSPDSPFFIIWKGILIITYLLTIFDVPLQFLNKYSENDSASSLIIFFYIPIFVFIAEIFFNFNTGFYREGQIVEEQQQIIENYVEFQFWLDTVTVCGFGISQILPTAKVLFLIRIYNLFLQIRQFEDRAQFTQRFPSFWTLLKLFTLIFCVAHFCGCGFSMIAYLENSNNQSTFTWLKKYNIQNDDWKTHYIYSLYFSFITMITVGYGDIVPQTNLERIYVIFMTLISAAVFGYSVNTIGAIFQDISAKSVNYRMLKRDIGQYMRSRGIDSQLQVKVYQYLSYYHLEAQQEHQQAEDVLSKLSNDLKLQIKKNYFGKALSTSFFLTSNFSPQFLTELTFKAKEAFYRQGDYVFQRNEVDQRLLILTKGQCELTFSHPTLNEVTLIKMDRGDVGSKGFMTGQSREVTLRTLSHCTFAFITIEDFLLTIKQFPPDYEKFCMLKDQIILYESESLQKLHCFSCNKFGHGVMSCPFIHLRTSKEMIIQKHLFSPQQHREIHKRQRTKMKNMIDIDIISHDLKAFRVDIIQAVKKDEDENDYYEELILKNDKEFLLAVECVGYDQETKTFTIDPKQAYLYPDDDDEEDVDEQEEDNSDSSISIYQGSIVIQDDQLYQKYPENNTPAKLNSRNSSSQSKRQSYQNSQQRASYNIESLTNLGEANQSKRQGSPNDQPSKDNQLNQQLILIPPEIHSGSSQKIDQQKQNLIKQPTIKFFINSNDQSYKKSSQTQINENTNKQSQKSILLKQGISQKESNPKQFSLLKSKTVAGGQPSQNNMLINIRNSNTNNLANINNSYNAANNNSNNLNINIVNHENNHNQNNNLNSFTLNYNKTFKNSQEKTPILKIQDTPPQASQLTNIQLQQRMSQRKSIKVVNPSGIFQSEQPYMQSLSFSQGEKLASKIYDLRKSCLLNGDIGQFINGFAYFQDYQKMHDMIYQVDFESAREYMIYFPNGNYNTIIKSIKQSKLKNKNIQSLKSSKSIFLNKMRINQTSTNIQ